MPKLDEFESQFRRASKERYAYEPVELHEILLVMDVDEDDAHAYIDAVKLFLKGAVPDGKIEEIRWDTLDTRSIVNPVEIIKFVEANKSDLIITRRMLSRSDNAVVQSLGTYIDVLAQCTETPVLLIPSISPEDFRMRCRDTTDVMVVSDRLAGDSRLINYGVYFTQPGGTLYLSNVENLVIFEKYMSVLSKIPSIDSESAGTEIMRQLEKESSDFQDECMKVILESDAGIRVEKIFQFGHGVADYKKLLEDHKVDLFIFNNKDKNQLAMNGLAYSLAVEMFHLPLLML